MKAGHEVPANATAARVVARGESFEYRTQAWSQDSPLPLPTMPVPNNGTLPDLTGSRVGRLRVIGYSADRKARWVCRCDCGMYTLRKTPALRNGTSAPCDQCYLLAASKARAHNAKTGDSKRGGDFL